MKEAERAVIGCLLVDCGLRVYARQLKKTDFADKHLGILFDYAMSIDGPVDLIIICDALERDGVAPPRGKGWCEFAAWTMDNIPSVEHVGEYVTIVRRSSIARRMAARSASGSSF